MKRATVALPLSVIIGLLVIACGGGDPTATPRSQPTPTPATAAQPTATRAPAGQATPTSVGAPQATSPARPSPSPAPAATAATAIKRGGVLKLGDNQGYGGGSFQSGFKNAQFSTGNTNATRLVYGSLFHYDPYDNQKFAGQLAESWQFNATADEVTIRIVQAAKWSDGKPVTAQDVKFTIDTFAKPPAGWVTSATSLTVGQGAARVDAVDEKNLKIGLKSPDVAFLALLADADVLIRPMHRTLEQSAKEPIGSGAYRIKEMQTDVKFVFDRNPNYWMKDKRGGALPYLDGVENLILSPDLGYAAILTGQIDVINTVWVAETLAKKDEIKQRMPKAILQERWSGNIGWGFRNAPPFDNQQVRRAMSILTDRLSLVEIDFAGQGVIDGIGVLPPESGSEWAIPSKEMLSQPGFRYVSKATGELELDPAKLQAGLLKVYKKDPKDIEMGKQMLRQAGMATVPDFTVTASTRYETRALALMQPLQEVLGNKIKLDIVDVTTARDKLNQGTYQAVVEALHPASLEPAVSLKFFTTGNGLWKHGFTVPELDALFVQQQRAIDPTKRRDIIFAMQREIVNTAHIIPGGNAIGPSGLVREWVKAFPMPVTSNSNVWGIDRAWLDK